MSLWKWHELCDALEIPVTDQTLDINGVSIDSRSLQPGDLFIALSGDPGPRFHSSSMGARDGHDFVQAAVQAGASSVVISIGRDDGVSIPVLRVPDTLDGLWSLGRAARKRISGDVVAVTGSAGKTTWRSWMETLLSQQAPTHASTSSLNNHWGVPLSMSRMPSDIRYAVFEVGTNNPGEIALLTDLVAPDVAVVLNVLPAHIGRFSSMDDLRREKLSLADGLKDDGIAVVPLDLDLSGSSVSDTRQITFGLSPDADVWGERVFDGIGDAGAFYIYVNDQRLFCRPPFGGAHRLLTLTAVFAALAALDAELERAARDVFRLTVPTGRGQVVNAGSWTLVDDSYNANPVSMGYAVEALHEEKGHRVALLGEMLELGSAGPSAHESVLSQALGKLDQVVTVGDAWPQLGQDFQIEQLEDAALYRFIDSIEKAAWGKPITLLIKGANKVFWANGFVDRLKVALIERQTGT